MKKYIVTVVCNNELQFVKDLDNKNKAIFLYLDMCKQWYNRESFEKFIKNNEQMQLQDAYDRYYDSKEYHSGCDYANVTLEESTGE